MDNVSSIKILICVILFVCLIQTEFAGEITDSINDIEAIRVITLGIIDAQEGRMNLF